MFYVTQHIQYVNAINIRCINMIFSCFLYYVLEIWRALYSDRTSQCGVGVFQMLNSFM